MIKKKIALVGNPNVGKSTLFNQLTGLRQKVGNYPGITVEKKTGTFVAHDTEYHVIDLPGMYGIHPSSLDEEVACQVLRDSNNPNHPELVVVIADPFHLARAIILYQQIREMGLAAIFVVNMIDAADESGLSIDKGKLAALLQTAVVFTDARSKKGLDELKSSLGSPLEDYDPTFSIPEEYTTVVTETKSRLALPDEYAAWLTLSQKNSLQLTGEQRAELERLRSANNIKYHRLQVAETMSRYSVLDTKLEGITKDDASTPDNFTSRLDSFLTHPLWGYTVFFALILLIFQAIYAWSEPFMEGIENGFAWLAGSLSDALPEGPVSGLITDGIISGIGGIAIFIPQIAILFIFISLMEESGYMSRVVFLMDRWLRPYGLSGKSAVPLMSGVACAIPAVMSARTIENDKERLITILVTPFMTCAARLPIYIVIIGLIIPEGDFLGFNLQGLVLFGMYLLGLLAALGSAWILKHLLKTNFKSFLILEMPTYRLPVLKNVLLTVWEKTWGFLWGAGRIILAISIILWVLGSFGIGEQFNNAEEIVAAENPDADEEELSNLIASHKLEHSLLGNIGHAIEPGIRPLGYDWKMGIGLVSSFAAREVFVGTMATVYSLGSTDDESTIRERMAREINPRTGEPAYNFASGLSLLLFYAFAMQCMSTIAIVRKETDSWKWTAIQFGFMTGLAYLVAFITYQILS